MKCPFCGIVDSDKVLDSRPVRENLAIKRRRECEEDRGGCGRRFTTFETIEELEVQIIKKDDTTREPFDRNKVLRSLQIALRKRPVGVDQIEAAVEEIERTIINRADKEVRSHEIGELVMEHLKSMDQVAYVRFASVYRQFEDATQFRDIVNMLTRKSTRNKPKD